VSLAAFNIARPCSILFILNAGTAKPDSAAQSRSCLRVINAILFSNHYLIFCKNDTTLSVVLTSVL
jgi:hypothetical protein